jgi:cytochrome b561
MLRNTDDAYGSVAVALHWLLVALIAAQLALGFVMVRVLPEMSAATFWAYQWHKSFGLLTLLVAFLRLVWALSGKRPAPAPGLPQAMVLAAGLVRLWLLAVPVLIAIVGWAIVSASPLAVPTIAFNLVVVPHLPVPRGDATEAFFSSVHALLAYMTLLLILGHAGAALVHHCALGDYTLRRMLPFRRDSARKRAQIAAGSGSDPREGRHD